VLHLLGIDHLRVAEDDTANATEAVDTNLRRDVNDCRQLQRGTASLP
jgi:hypothetical protein